MSQLYVVARDQGEDYMLISIEGGVLAFEGKHVAEDFSDRLDMDGEFVVLPYEATMGPMVVVT